MARNTQHENIGTGAENFVFGTGDHHGADFRVLKTDAVDGVIQLNIHTQIVAVQLEFVARTQTSVFVNINRQGSNGAIERQLPMLVLRWVGLVLDFR